MGRAGLVPEAARGRGKRSSHEETETQIASGEVTGLADSRSDCTCEVLSTTNECEGHTSSIELQSEIPPEHEWKSSKSEPYHSGFLQRAQHPADSTKLWMPQTASSEMVQLSGHCANKTGCSREVVVIVKLNTHHFTYIHGTFYIHIHTCINTTHTCIYTSTWSLIPYDSLYINQKS